jgi:hypothetical protein
MTPREFHVLRELTGILRVCARNDATPAGSDASRAPDRGGAVHDAVISRAKIRVFRACRVYHITIVDLIAPSLRLAARAEAAENRVKAAGLNRADQTLARVSGN